MFFTLLLYFGDKMVLAFVQIIVETGKEKDAVKKLKTYKEVKEVHMVYGEFDLLCKVKAKDLKSLDKLVTKMRKLKSVRATSTMITMG